MKIAMVASESNPLAKTGGLGDVVYSLSKALVRLGLPGFFNPAAVSTNRF